MLRLTDMMSVAEFHAGLVKLSIGSIALCSLAACNPVSTSGAPSAKGSSLATTAGGEQQPSISILPIGGGGGNGDGFDGKPSYILPSLDGLCADGSRVRARIFVDDETHGFLRRDKCTDLAANQVARLSVSFADATRQKLRVTDASRADLLGLSFEFEVVTSRELGQLAYHEIRSFGAQACADATTVFQGAGTISGATCVNRKKDCQGVLFPDSRYRYVSCFYAWDDQSFESVRALKISDHSVSPIDVVSSSDVTPVLLTYPSASDAWSAKGVAKLQSVAQLELGRAYTSSELEIIMSLSYYALGQGNGCAGMLGFALDFNGKLSPSPRAGVGPSSSAVSNDGVNSAFARTIYRALHDTEPTSAQLATAISALGNGQYTAATFEANALSNPQVAADCSANWGLP